MTRNEKNIKELKEELNTAKQENEKYVNMLITTAVLMIITSVLIILPFAWLGSIMFPYSAFLGIMFYAFGFITFCFLVGFVLTIEQSVGYFKCKKCGHYHVPTRKQLMWSMHFGFTHYLKCPKCGKRSWNKKKWTKD